ncbi:BlaI/MecI/CopY family transcriptional regulator [Phaeodactylibacter sp.]|jgi:predicted transcriptional regulator|uniref:BlaI/MecI/CopY family transcriptional regulator n=1 Tax=Phaeodactylibacter sp. TaxID=1940289 RepID=UPI0025EF5754|nr:BlaI/MecI/CopY family transcriptional regulator [Phaeodactylibacter sp.]MCI4647967.1 BlaI/MecI/CopY family transcriptional regulator [Phaeodactylibacter sp.]MCI5089692.1 BlaI/MecI/CopY family transcriptional regulator [Phaeodactylibacter sp.]
MKKKPTEAELEVLQILWKHGPCSVRFVNTELSKNREVVYTTTLKMMQVMTEKGFLQRDTSSRTHLYEAIVTEKAVKTTLVDRMVDTVFQGSPLQLAIQALGHTKADSEDLEALKEIIRKLENQSKS